MKTFFVLWIWIGAYGNATDHYETLKECEAARYAIAKSYAEISKDMTDRLLLSSKCLEVNPNNLLK